jgi:hypothetical protein
VQQLNNLSVRYVPFGSETTVQDLSSRKEVQRSQKVSFNEVLSYVEKGKDKTPKKKYVKEDLLESTETVSPKKKKSKTVDL